MWLALNGDASLVVSVVTVRVVTTIMKAASVSGYSASKYSAGVVRMWLNYKRGSRGNS